MSPLPPDVRAAAQTVLSYLGETDSVPATATDAVIGFGVFDLTLPQFCADLFAQGCARRIIFTGGFGAGSGDLGGPEADVWRAEARRIHPQMADDAIITENRSTNTSENIAFTAELLARDYPAQAFGVGIQTAIIVASPSRLRRVRLTLWKQQPAVRVIRMLPRVDLDAEYALYTRQGVDYLAHLTGEIDRITAYPERGWIVPEPLPAKILAAGDVLRRATR